MMKKLLKNRLLLNVLILALLVVAILASLASYGFSKYRTDVVLTGQVSYVNQLAGGFQLLEHVPVAQPDGSYVQSDQTGESAEYYLIPGITLPMDPYISITAKTEIPAYLYLEVYGEAADRYELTEDWTELPGVRGVNGGKIYVFDNGAALDETTAGLETIRILKDEQLTLSPVPAAEGDQTLTFCGYLLQAGEDPAAEAFTAKFPQN